MTDTKKRCEFGAIKADNGMHLVTCSRPATVEHEGEFYCWQHDPNRKDVRKRKTEEKDPPESSTCVAPRCRNTAVMEFLGLRICERCYQKYVDMEERKFGYGRKWLGLPDHTPEEYAIVEKYRVEK